MVKHPTPTCPPKKRGGGVTLFSATELMMDSSWNLDLVGCSNSSHTFPNSLKSLRRRRRSLLSSSTFLWAAFSLLSNNSTTALAAGGSCARSGLARLDHAPGRHSRRRRPQTTARWYGMLFGTCNIAPMVWPVHFLHGRSGAPVLSFQVPGPPPHGFCLVVGCTSQPLWKQVPTAPKP